MRRWVLIMLMLLLPLQGWATAQSGICPSRCDCSGAVVPAGQATHDAALQEVDDASVMPQHADGCGPANATPADQGACDGDCHACHVPAMSALVGQAQTQARVPSGVGHSDYASRITQHVSEPLLRPPTAGL